MTHNVFVRKRHAIQRRSILAKVGKGSLSLFAEQIVRYRRVPRLWWRANVKRDVNYIGSVIKLPSECADRFIRVL